MASFKPIQLPGEYEQIIGTWLQIDRTVLNGCNYVQSLLHLCAIVTISILLCSTNVTTYNCKNNTFLQGWDDLIGIFATTNHSQHNKLSRFWL